MAKRGARPKPSQLRVIDGTHRSDRHGDAPDCADYGVREALIKPADIPEGASDAWDRWISRAVWLDWSREPAAIAFCHLWSEFIYAPSEFQSARHAQMRAYMNELGLTDERARSDDDSGGRKDPGERYFD